jgi:hypothetical protein
VAPDWTGSRNLTGWFVDGEMALKLLHIGYMNLVTDGLNLSALQAG